MISVFGASGFIGNRFCEIFPNDVIKINRDVRIPSSNDVLYLISTTHNYHVFSDPTLDVKTNLFVLTEFLNECREKKNTINFVSSWFVYGDSQLPVDENSICHPKGFYSITKLCAERLVTSYCRTFDIPYRIIRLGNVYGNSDKGMSKKKNALQFLISRLKKNEPIDLYYGGDFLRDYIHVDDVCQALRLIIEKAPLNDIINVACGESLVFIDLVDMAVAFLDSSSEINNIAPPTFHDIVQVKDMHMNIDKLKSLGFKPHIRIEEGIKRLCQD